MITLRRAAEQALAAIKSANQVNYSWACVEAVAALETALAEDALQRLTDVQQEIEAALAEPNKCIHGVTDGNCKECYMAEPDQEPVAWMYSDDHDRMLETETFCTVYSVKVGSPDKGVTDVPLYTAPPQRKPLTEKEVTRLIYENTKINPNVADDRELLGYIVNAARAIEAAHGIKVEA